MVYIVLKGHNCYSHHGDMMIEWNMDLLFGKYAPHMKILMSAAVLFWVATIIYQMNQRIKTRKALKKLAEEATKLTVVEFFKLRNTKKSDNKSYISKDYGFTGVYVIHNESADLYYVGQGKNVMNRVNSHFTGRGNGDIYADYKYGDQFTIQMISLQSSGYQNLDELELKMIQAYNAYEKGYNRNRGNNFRNARY